MLEVSVENLIKSLRNLATIAKWTLVLLNVILFYIVFRYAAYISLSWGDYVIYGFHVKWFNQSYLSYVISCWISAVVFLVVSWRTIAPPPAAIQLIILAAMPAIFVLVFGEMVHLML